MFFETCLNNLAILLGKNSNINTVYFPYKIGCAAAGGNSVRSDDKLVRVQPLSAIQRRDYHEQESQKWINSYSVNLQRKNNCNNDCFILFSCVLLITYKR